jgi:hypothetical protein
VSDLETGKQLPSFYEVQRVENGYDTYIIGCFPRRGVYVLGVMDLEDPKAWQGGVSDLVLYFAVTPQELGWLKSDRSKLDDLAGRIQRELPRSRFVAGLKNGRELEPALEKDWDGLKSDALEGDEDFDRWMETHPFRMGRQLRTPLTDARHELAEFQQGLRGRTPTPKETQEERRRQRTFAYRLLEAEALFVAMDENSPGGQWPGLEYISGDVHLFTTEANGDTACGYYAKNQIYDYQVQRVEQAQYAAFFENCRGLGVEQFQVDDGVEPVQVALKYLVLPREESWLEEHNRWVRNMMLRSLEVSGHMAKHSAGMAETLRKNLMSCMVTWRIRMLQELGDTLFYVPSALPQEMHQQFERDMVFSKQALDRLKKKLDEELRPRSAIVGVHFTGRVATIENSNQGKLPLRLVHDPQERKWLVAFTSEAACRTFVENQQEGDTVVILTLDELYDQVEGLAGLVVDAAGLSVQLRAEEIEQCLTLRKREKASIRLEKKKEPAQAEEQDSTEEKTRETPAEAEKQPLTNQQKLQKVCEKTKKGGILARLFRRKH